MKLTHTKTYPISAEHLNAFSALSVRLEEAQRDVETAQDDLKDLRLDKAKAEAHYQREKNKKMVLYRKEGATIARASAEEQTADQLETWRIAEALVKSGEDALQTKRELVRDIRQRMSNFQSVSSMARTEAEMAGRSA